MASNENRDPRERGALEDRDEIASLYVTYAHALDTRELGLLERCFAADVRLEYQRLGEVFDLDQFKAMAERNLGGLDDTQHLVSNFLIEVADDRATARVAYTSHHVRQDLAPDQLYTTGGWYEDTLVRGPHGWRVTERVARPVWAQGNPAVLGFPAPRVGGPWRRLLRRLRPRR